MSSEHWLQATHETEASDGTVTGSTEVRFTFDYVPGRPAYTPRGEYAPIDPPDPPEVQITKIEVETFVNGQFREATPDEFDRFESWYERDDSLYRAMCRKAERS